MGFTGIPPLYLYKNNRIDKNDNLNIEIIKTKKNNLNNKVNPSPKWSHKEKIKFNLIIKAVYKIISKWEKTINEWIPYSVENNKFYYFKYFNSSLMILFW